MNPETGTVDRITVCVCTYRRPEFLMKLLDSLANQEKDTTFSFDVVVVDNDETRSAEAIVAHIAQRAAIAVTYDCEPVRNISLARNRAIKHATGNLVAFIDDDERPGSDWLRRLHETMREYTADGVLGPVIPDFPPESPSWLREGGVSERERYPTGSYIGASDARTGNVLLERSLFVAGENWFDPAFGRTGGEDSEFFSRQFRKGRTFVWCNEAVALEAVPPERWTATFHIRRLWRSGTLTGEWMREGRLPAAFLTKSVFGLGVWGVAAPLTIALPKHIRMRVAQKLAYHAGVVTAFVGFSMLRHRE